ncbi:MAG: 4-(cytidine 5'-diphospho)-2-C-methyl-D-erythritol kinase [Thermaerobacter sp.]|nr:4-(cytidine 5'-diphospho)-2-C-methyl-D-erythritol kinase [Thermaerobacter sp.]
MRFFAPAKLNLSLDLGALRADGYHEIRTVMQAVSLGDRLFVMPEGKFTVENPLIREDDLVRRAGELFAQATGRKAGVRIRVQKRIPIGAGLGGGSSDAACTLRALRGLLRPDMPDAELLALGAQLGSDVPFFLGPSPLALAEGRGEILTPLSAREPLWAVIAWPGEGLSTAAVYRDSAHGTGGATEQVLFGAACARNDLEAAAVRLSPALQTLLRAAQAGGAPLQVTGSGSAAFALYKDAAAAGAGLHAVRFAAQRAVLCTTITAWPWQRIAAHGNE